MSLAPGTKLGPYEIIAPLGAGGMGEVYRARDTRLGRDVALKILPESFARDADRLRRFELEARAVAALNHPNILAIHDIGEQGGTPFLVSELLEGVSLRTELESGPLSPRKATDYAVQIAQGLSAAHDKNIVHRDLKPENIFLSKDGRVKILDFGLAKTAPGGPGAKGETAATLTSSPTDAGMVMGTAGYMAPEQVRGLAVDARTDIFAFGSVLYEMLSGKRAFRRDTGAETMTAILKEDPPELSEMSHPVPLGLERVVRRCLEKQPEQRFQSAKDVAFALEALSGTTSKSGPAVAIAAPAQKPRWIGMAVVAVLALAAGAAIAWLLRPAPMLPPSFSKVSFHRGEVIRARIAPDGKTVYYSAQLNGGPADTFVIRDEYPESVPVGLQGALLLAISRQGQMAVLVRPQYLRHYQWGGTLATLPVGGTASRELLENVVDADWSPDGSELAVIDHPEKEWQLEYPVGKVLLHGNKWISDARVSPDGQQVALFVHTPSGDDRGDVITVDRSGKVTALSSGWESLEGLAWAQSGKEVWFSAAESGEEYCIRAVTLSGKTRTVHCGTAPSRIHDISASGEALVSTEENRVLMALKEHGAGDERDLSWLDNPYGPRLSRDGGLLLFTDQSGHGGHDYSVYVRKTDGSAAVRIGGGGFGSDISPDGKWALVLLPGDPENKIQLVPVGPGQARVLHWDKYAPLWALWFPDGKHLLMSAILDGQSQSVFVVDTSGSPPRLLSAQDPRWVGISPDGNWIFTHQDQGWVAVSVEGKTTKLIPGMKGSEYPIAWAEDSKHVFTQADTPTGLNIYKIDVDSGQKELWQALNPKDQVGLRPMVNATAITPDGRWMAFTYATQLGQLYRSSTLQ